MESEIVTLLVIYEEKQHVNFVQVQLEMVAMMIYHEDHIMNGLVFRQFLSESIIENR